MLLVYCMSVAPKTRAPRNRTLVLEVAEQARYEAALLTLTGPCVAAAVENRTLCQDGLSALDFLVHPHQGTHPVRTHQRPVSKMPRDPGGSRLRAAPGRWARGQPKIVGAPCRRDGIPTAIPAWCKTCGIESRLQTAPTSKFLPQTSRSHKR